MRCRQCEHENPEGGKVCGECGAPLPIACPSCGTENPAANKFCGECGARLAAAPAAAPAPTAATAPGARPDWDARLAGAAPSSLVDKLRHLPGPIAGERRRVTILFADLKGSTALGERLDPEEVYDVMNQCFRALVDIVYRHEGYVDKFTGDGIMALFGAPLAHGDDPQRAVQAGLDMQEWLAKFSRELERRRGIPFQMRIGLNFGAVVAGEIGSDLRMAYDVLGDPVNVAKRLEEMAEPGTVYASASVQQITRRHFDYLPVGSLAVKGRSEEVIVYRVLGPLASDSAGHDSSSITLIGREKEREALAAAVVALAEGEGRFVTIAGEPGIGKTRLLEEASQFAAGLGIRSRGYRCSERHQHTPYELFRILLREMCGVEESDDPDRMTQKVEETLRRLDPGLQEWLPYLTRLLSSAPAGTEQSGLAPQTRKSLTIRGLCEVIASVGRSAPLLLVLDDLQWIDEMSLEVVCEIVRRLGQQRILLIAAYRPELAYDWPSGARRDALTLDVLDRGQCVELIRGLVDPEALPEKLLAGILDRSGGNPYYLEEVVRSLIDSGQLVREGNRWHSTAEIALVEVPDTVYGAIMARLDRLERLDRTAKCVVQSGAVVGVQFAVYLVEQLLEVRESLEDSLFRLEALEFLRQQIPRPEWVYRFKHTAIRDVAYETLLIQQRKQYHRRVADLLLALYPARESESAEVLAYHFRMAEDWPRAAQYLVMAGERARELYANSDAIRHYSEALELLERMAPAEIDGIRPFELTAHEGLAEVYSRFADYTAAVASYGRALENAYLASMEPPERALRAAAIKRGMAKCLFETGAEKRAGSLLQEAFRALRRYSSPEVAREQSMVVGEFGFARYRAGRYRQAERLGRWSLRLAEQGGGELEMGDASNLLGLACQARGRFADSIEHYRRTLDLSERTGNLAAIGAVLNNLGNLYYQHAQFDEADECYERAQRLWQKTGDVAQLATTYSNAGNVHLGRGDYVRAAGAFDAAISLFRQASHPYGAAAALAVLGEVRLECGECAAAIESLEEAQALADSLSVPDLAAYIHTVLASAFVEQGDLAAGERECRRALELTESLQHTPFEGVARRTLGKIARLRRDAETANAELCRAQAIFGEIELPYELGRTLVERSALLWETEHIAEAEKCLREAIELFRSSGARGDLERAESLWQARHPSRP